MLFCPSSVPWELSQDMFSDKVKPMKLFVKRVFISDAFEEELLPRWLSFLKGMVDSEELPLNVSREILQKSKVLSIISKRLVRKALDMFDEIAKDKDKFARFQSNFGRYIKVGLIEDRDNKEKLYKFATFATTYSEDAVGSTLNDYVGRMKDGQKAIYYVSGTSRAAAASSPVLERLQQKGYEVLFALDQIDEIALQGVGKFGDFDVVDAAKESTDLGELSEEEKSQDEAAKAELEGTTKFIKTTLGATVDKVEVSTRLTSSPSALVQPQWGMSPQMQKFMKAQAAAAGGDAMGAMGGMAANLEINPSHPVVTKLKSMVDDEAAGGAAKQYAQLLYEVAAVSSGYEVNDPAAFTKRITALMAGGEEALGALDSTLADGGEAPEAGEAAPTDEVLPEDVPIEPEVGGEAPEAGEAAPTDEVLPEDVPIEPEVV